MTLNLRCGLKPTTFFLVWILGVASASAQEPRLERSGGTLESECLIDASNRVKVGASVPGLISKVLVNRGDRVKAGDVIARLDSGVEEALVLIAKSRAANDTQIFLTQHQSEYRSRRASRLSKLKVNDTIPEAQLDEATTDARVAAFNHREAQQNQELSILELRRAEEQLKQKIVRSPVDGVVVERSLSSGEYRHDQAHILTLAQLNPLHVEVFLPIARYGRISIGQGADIRPESPVGGNYRGTVTVVDEVLDAPSGTFGVRLALPNPNQAIPAGLRCQVRFDDAVGGSLPRAG